eukprot:1161778-Pelagomonas_calceolata.AAC.1
MPARALVQLQVSMCASPAAGRHVRKPSCMEAHAQVQLHAGTWLKLSCMRAHALASCTQAHAKAWQGSWAQTSTPFRMTFHQLCARCQGPGTWTTSASIDPPFLSDHTSTNEWLNCKNEFAHREPGRGWMQQSRRCEEVLIRPVKVSA